MSNNTIKESVANKLLDESASLLNVPSVAYRLGDYRDRLMGALDRVEYAGVGPDGFMQVSGELYKIPLVVRGLGEIAILHSNDAAMNPYQIESLVSEIGDRKAESADQKFRSKLSHKELPIFDDVNQLGATVTAHWKPPNEQTIVEGRPVVSMNHEVHKSGFVSPIVFLHELIHVLQKEKKPKVCALPEVCTAKISLPIWLLPILFSNNLIIWS